MTSKKPKNKLTCPGIIKLVLKDFDWLSYDELYSKVNDIWWNKCAKKKNVRQDTFTKALNELLKNKEITIRKTIESENPFEYNPSKDHKKYYFKLTSNFSYKLSSKIDADELMLLLKEKHTNYIFENNPINTIIEHNCENLYLEIEASNILIKKLTAVYNYYKRKVTTFLIDIYKYNSPNDANLYFEDLTKFNNTSTYEDKTLEFKKQLMHIGDKISNKDCAQVNDASKNSEDKSYNQIITKFKYRFFRVKIDNSSYINKKDYHYENGFDKVVILAYNLVIIIYDYRPTDELHIKNLIETTNIILNYLILE